LNRIAIFGKKLVSTISKSLGQHLATAYIGNISEIFDAEPPYTPRGCCAQAWSVAEVLRLLTVTGSMLHEQEAA
jgi:glycogen debranching enzyme